MNLQKLFAASSSGGVHRAYDDEWSIRNHSYSSTGPWLEGELQAEQEWTERRQLLHKQISVVDAESKRLVSAISTGGDIPVLVEALKAAHERRETLSCELAHVDNQQHSNTDYDGLEKDLQAHFETSWKTILSRQVGPTRQILRKLFNGNRVAFTPIIDHRGFCYEFKGSASLSGLVTGRAKALVSPTGNTYFKHVEFQEVRSLAA